ncbi:MAG: WD40 repeat domain-containing protein, partial [Planctomycetota bacterium]
DEAWEVIQAARDVGFDTAAVTAQETLIRQSLRRRENEPLRRRAEAAMAEALKAAPGQGVEALRQQAQQHAAEAKQRYDANDFDLGARLCRDVIVECDAIVAVEARRALSLSARAAATAAVAKIAPLTDAHGFGAIKNLIRQTFAAAEAFFEQRQFDQADGPYERTTAECKRLVELETTRVELEAWRQKLPGEQQKAAAAEVPKWAPDKWRKMEESHRTGQAAFDQGDFVKARADWGPLVEGYAAAAANVDVLRAVYDGQLLWDQARGYVPKEYLDQMDRYGGADWQAVKALVAAAENEKAPQAERIAAYKKASLRLTVVAEKVEELHRRAMCEQVVGEARALLAGVPRRATERTGEHVAQAQKALDAATRALAYRATDPAAMEVAQEAKALATPLKTGVCLRTMPAQKAWLLALAMDPAGDKAVTGGEDSSLRLWDVWRGTEGATWEGHAGGTYAVAFAADGRTVLSGGEDATVRLSAPGGAGQPVKFVGHTAPVTGVAFAPDGRTVLSSSEDGTVRMWDVASARIVRTFTGHTGAVNAVAFSPDGKRALSAGADRTVRLWDVATGQCLLVLEGHGASVTAVAWSGEGGKAVSAGMDKTVKVWDLASGRALHTLTGHTAGVDCVAFSPDGRRAMSGGRDETVRLWDVVTGACIAAFEGHRGWVRSVAFGPDGTTAVSLDETAMKVWYVGKGEPPKK